jgi:hypothetical protein
MKIFTIEEDRIEQGLSCPRDTLATLVGNKLVYYGGVANSPLAVEDERIIFADVRLEDGEISLHPPTEPIKDGACDKAFIVVTADWKQGSTTINSTCARPLILSSQSIEARYLQAMIIIHQGDKFTVTNRTYETRAPKFWQLLLGAKAVFIEISRSEIYTFDGKNVYSTGEVVIKEKHISY